MNGRGRVALLEALAVVIILASVTALAIPKAAELRRGGDATRLQADLDVLRGAIFAFYSDSAYFPAQGTLEEIPESLRPYLPETFAARRSYGRLAYRHWPVAATADAPASSIIGVTATMQDPRVGAIAAARVARGAPTTRLARFVIGDQFTFLYFGV